jgi:hypothetical protein
MRRTLLTALAISAAIAVPLLGVAGLGTYLQARVLRDRESVIHYTIPPIRIWAYGGLRDPNDNNQYAISTLKTSGCDPDRVLAALNKVGIEAAYTTTHAEKTCIDIQGGHPFKEMILNGNYMMVVPNPYTAEKYPSYMWEKLATEIRWAH